MGGCGGGGRWQDASRMFGLFKYSQKGEKQCETHSEGENRLPAAVHHQTGAGLFFRGFFLLT